MDRGPSATRREEILRALAHVRDEALWSVFDEGKGTAPAFETAYRFLLGWARTDPPSVLEVMEELGRRGLRRLRPEERARFVRLRAHALRASTRLGEAARSYADAVRRFEELGDTVEAGRTAIGWIDALSMLGRHDEALEVGRKARRRLARADAPTRARLETNIGTVHYHVGRVDRALEAYRKARRTLRRSGDPADVALVDFNLGQVHLQRTDPKRARTCFERCLEVFDARGLRAQALRAEFGLACAYLYDGQWDEGLRRLEASREALDEAGDSQAVAAVHWELSRLFGAFGEFEDAATHAHDAGAIYRRRRIVRDAAHVQRLHARWSVALGRDSDAAVLLERAHRHFSEVGDRATLRRIELERAAVALESGDTDAARSILRRLQPSLDRSDPESAVRCRSLLARTDLQSGRPGSALRRARAGLDRARSFPEKLERPSLALVIAQAHAAGGRHTEACRWARQAAREVDRLARTTGEDALRRTLWSLQGRIVREAIGIVLAHGGARAERDALDLLSRALSRDLVEDLLDQMPGLSTSTRARIALLREQLVRSELDEPGDVRAHAVSRDLARLDRSLQADLRRRYDVVRRAVDQSRLEAWRPRLGAEEAVVVVDHHERHWSAFVVEGRRVRHVELEGADEALRQHWRPLQLLFEAAAGMPAPRRERFLERTRAEAEAAIRALRRELWEPLGVQPPRVHLVMPPELEALPLEALIEGHGPVPDADGTGPRDRDTVVSRWPHPALIRNDHRRAEGPAVLVHDGGEGTRGEVESIARRLRAEGAEVVVGSRRSSLPSSGGVGVFHVAAHGAVAHGHWTGTGMLLEDGWMGIEEIAGDTRFRDALLFFASCSSGQSSLRAQGRFDGWAAAGLSSGAREIVMALWKIDDASSQAFSEAFYARWCAGDRAAEAASGVRRELRDRGLHPYHWAAFTVVG